MSASVSLSLFWFFYFCGVGIYFPYFSLYLRENAGLSSTEVGLVLATWPLVGLVTQPLWGYVADRTGRRSRVLTLVTAGAAIGYFALGKVEGFPALALTTACLAAFAGAVVPMLFSVSFAALREAPPQAFGYARVWGTIGFLILVVAFPWLLHQWQAALGLTKVAGGPSEPGLEAMFPAVALFTTFAALIGLGLPRTGAIADKARQGQWRTLLRHPPLWRLTAFTLLAYLFTQGPMAMFPMLIRARGGSIDTVGNMWVFMVLLEIPLVLAFGRGMSRFGVRSLLGIGVFAAGLRWVLCAALHDMTALYAAQLLHGIVVAGLMLGAPLYLEAIVPDELRSSGQTMVATVSIGIGSMISNFAAGWLMQNVADDAPYWLGGIGAIVLGLATPWILPPPRRMASTPSPPAPLPSLGEGSALRPL